MTDKCHHSRYTSYFVKIAHLRASIVTGRYEPSLSFSARQPIPGVGARTLGLRCGVTLWVTVGSSPIKRGIIATVHIASLFGVVWGMGIVFVRGYAPGYGYDPTMPLQWRYSVYLMRYDALCRGISVEPFSAFTLVVLWDCYDGDGMGIMGKG